MAVTRLSSGGLIVNYRCPAACGHCMYGCSPTAEPGYMTEDMARDVCARLHKLGCRGLHIGGGEPFLHVDGLVNVIRIIRESGIAVDYIETNAAWVTGDPARDYEILNRVAGGGVTVMVSADPFHVQYIPYWKPKTLISMLRKAGFSYFIWQERYIPLLERLDPSKTYDAVALRDTLGFDAQERCAREYGLGFNGRALNLIRPAAQRQQAEEWLSRTPCGELSRTGHFHVDLTGRYIAPGCTGMGILLDDLDTALPQNRYPVLSRLLSGGTKELYDYAAALGFVPDVEGYASKCDLCYALRKHLSLQDADAHPDLSPASYYRQDF